MVANAMFVVKSLDDLVFKAIENRRLVAQILRELATMAKEVGRALEVSSFSIVYAV